MRMNVKRKPAPISGGAGAPPGGDYDPFGVPVPEKPAPLRKKARGEKSGGARPEKRVKTLSRLAGAAVAVAVFGGGYGLYAWAATDAMVAELRDGTVPVVTAREAIPAGTVVSARMVETREVPAGYAVSARLEDASSAVGQRTLTDVPAGAQITESLFAGPSDTSTMANNLAEGSVAVTLAVDAENGYSGMLRQGDRVRVVGYAQTVGGDLEAETLVRSARVAALDASLEEVPSSYSTVTVEVSPEEAYLVKAAQAGGAGGGVDVLLLPSSDQASGAVDG